MEKAAQLERYSKLVDELKTRNINNPLLIDLEKNLKELQVLWK